MGGCSIRNCKSKSVKGGSIMFFSFPPEEKLAEQWLRCCGPNTTKKYGRVCSKHFSESDFIQSLSLLRLKNPGRSIRPLKPDAIPTLHIDSMDKQNTLNTSVEGISTNCLAHGQKPLIKGEVAEEISKPANEVVGSSNAVNKSYSENTMRISLAEYDSLIKTAKSVKKLQTLKTNLEKVFTPAQIRCLMAPEKRRVQWSAEDITRAITLRSISRKAYHHLRATVGIPLPGLSTLRKWVAASNAEFTEELLGDFVLLSEIQSEDLELTGEIFNVST